MPLSTGSAVRCACQSAAKIAERPLALSHGWVVDGDHGDGERLARRGVHAGAGRWLVGGGVAAGLHIAAMALWLAGLAIMIWGDRANMPSLLDAVTGRWSRWSEPVQFTTAAH